MDAQALRWCLLPDFDLQFSRPRMAASWRARVRATVLRGVPWRFAPSRHSVVDGVLVVTRAVNEERVVDPLLPGRSPVSFPGLRDRPDGEARRDPAAVELLAWAEGFLVRHGRVELLPRWRDAVWGTAHHLQRYLAADWSRFRAVVVPRQSHPFVRALIVAAEAHGVPVVFVPHSPLTHWQVDLPVSYAGMRGVAERETIVRVMGADPVRIDVIGRPDTDLIEAPMPVLRRELPGVVAVSPDPEWQLRELFELVRAADVGPVVVAPHPRSDRAVLQRIVPRGWSIASTNRTLELLREGPPWLIQCSSGVAWESAVLGIPTGDVRLGGRRPDYPFLESPVFAALTSSDDVRRFVGAAAARDRAALRAESLGWCAIDGAAAVARGRALIDSADRALAGRRIADAWAPGGVLERRSPLTSGETA